MLSTGNVTVDPAVTPYLAFWPLPNAGLDPSGDVGNYRVATNQIGNENFYTGKVDHHHVFDTAALGWLGDGMARRATFRLNFLLACYIG